MSTDPIINFYRSQPKEKCPDYTVKVTINGQVSQYRTPIFGDAPFDTNEDLLNTCRTFNRNAQRLNWTNETCIEHFESVVSLIYVHDWQSTVNKAPPDTMSAARLNYKVYKPSNTSLN
jgi:hypothetical protein